MSFLESLTNIATKTADVGKEIIKGLLGGTKVPPKGHGSSNGIDSGSIEQANQVLGLIYRSMLRARELQKETHSEEMDELRKRDEEEDKRNQEIIKALTVRRKKPKKKEPPTEKPTKTEPTPAPKTEPKAGPKAEPKAAPKAEPKAAPKAEPTKPTAKEAPKPTAEKAPKVETKPSAVQAPRPTPSVGKDIAGAVKAGAGVIGTITAALIAAGITNVYAQKAILANVGKETGFKPKTENLKGYANTDNERIRKVFTTRATKYSDSELNEIKKDEYKFGEMVYGKDTKIGQSMGNTEPGDGYKYRGRGSIQLTGKNNYKAYSGVAGVDLVKNPDALNTPEIDIKVVTEFVKKGTKGKLDFKNQQEANRAVTQAIGGASLNLDKGYGSEVLSKVDAYSEALSGNTPAPMPTTSAPNTGKQIDESSKDNKELKSSLESKKQTTVNNNNTTQKTSPSPAHVEEEQEDDRRPYDKKR